MPTICPGCAGRSTLETLTCPWCGRPLHSNRGRRPVWRLLALAMLLAVAIGGLGWVGIQLLAR